MMKDFHIGSLTSSSAATLRGEEEAADSPATSNEPPPPQFLNPKTWRKALLKSKTSVSSDSRVLTFTVDTPTQPLGLPTGQHLMIRLKDPATRETIIRAYTPISHESAAGVMEVLVKVYDKGKMTQALDGIPVGHAVDFKGPVGKFTWLGKGRCVVGGTERKVSTLVMVCGGSGVTPIYQVFRAVMEDRDDPTRCIVLNGSRAVEDILCREELDRLAEIGRESGKAKLIHTLSAAKDGSWEGRRGRIAGPLLREFAGDEELRTAGNAMALICGPEAMEKSVKATLLEMGWNERDLLFF